MMAGAPDPEPIIENGVLIGHEGDLFLAGGRHEILRFIRGARLSPRAIQTLHDNIVRRQVMAARHNARFLQIVAPEKYVVYPENFPIPDPGFMAQAYLEAGHDDILYPVELLRRPRQGRSYWQTDTHWTPMGLLAMAERIAQEAGLPPATIEAVASDLAARLTVEGDFVGDLGRKLSPPRGEPRHVLPPQPGTRVHENGVGHDFTQPVNDGRLILVESPRAVSDRILLIFGDSYLFHGLDILSRFFRRILFTRTRFFHEEMVEAARPHLVVSQMAERYMASAVSDLSAPPFWLIPWLLGRSQKMDLETALAFTRALSSGRVFDPASLRIAVPAPAAEGPVHPPEPGSPS